MNYFLSYYEYLLNETAEKLTKKELTSKEKEKSIKNAADGKEKSIYPDEKEKTDTKTGQKKMDKSLIPRDVQIKALAKELHNAQYNAITMQSKVDDLILTMTKANPDNPDVAILQASSAIQIANAQLRADSIEQQMLAIAAQDKTGNLTNTATELAQEAKNLAMKRALDEYGDNMYKLKRKAEKEILLKQKDKEKKGDKEEDEEE